MDVLKDKTFNNFDYICRYNSTAYFYHTLDKKYVYGIGEQLSKDTPYTLHKLKDTDTLDSLSLKYYNNPTYFWVIASFNNIFDIYEPLLKASRQSIRIPSIAAIYFEDPRN